MNKRILFTCFLIINSLVAIAQKDFFGSFLMTFKIQNKPMPEQPLYWSVQKSDSEGKLAMEIQDTLKTRGLSKRVVYHPKDSTWTSLMSFNDIKTGIRLHRAKMFQEESVKYPVTIKKTKETRLISGLSCKKIITDSKHFSSEIWITTDYNFDMCHLYKILSHCTVINEVVRKGDWYKQRFEAGMIMEVTTTRKLSGEKITMQISSLAPYLIKNELFITKNYKISDAFEGQNCGMPMEE